MRIITNLSQINEITPSVVTIGVFDGVHIGHQAIMSAVKRSALERGVKSVVITFDRNPIEIVDKNANIPYITILEQKLRLIEEQGIDMALVLPIEEGLVQMSAEAFVADIMRDKLAVVKAVVGSNFAFGKGRAGNARLLGLLAGEYGYELEVIQPVKCANSTVSSTAIRKIISSGKIETASEMLGHPYVMHGKVVKGRGIGKSIGYPTANLKPANMQVVPSDGVYTANVEVGGKERQAVVSLGTRPTIGDGNHTIEVYIIEYSGDLYGAEIEIAFLHKLREEKKFENMEELKSQIAGDIEKTILLNKNTAIDHI